MKNKVVLCEPINEVGHQLLVDNGFEVVTSPSAKTEDLVKVVPGAVALIVRTSKLDNAVIDAADSLKLISRHGIGFDNIDVDYATSKGILVSRVLNANSYSVAEYTVTVMMTMGRNIVGADSLVRTGKLSDSTASLPGLVKKYQAGGREIKGKTLGIIGFGNIGSMIAKLAEGLGVSVVTYDPYITKELPGITKYDELADLLKVSDFVTLNVPLTDSTKNLINKDTLKLMKPTAYLINPSRGGIVNEADLTEALNNGVIAGATVDVFSVEPPQLDNPLFSAKNIILTPHIAGTTKEAIDNLSLGAAQAVVDFCEGKVPTYVVNKEVLGS